VLGWTVKQDITSG